MFIFKIVVLMVMLALFLFVIWFGWYMLYTNKKMNKYEEALDNIKTPCPECGHTLKKWHTDYTFGADCENCGYERFVG